MSEQTANLQQRVTELEISLAHQQRLCEQLNEVVTEQTRKLMHLERLIPRLEEQLRELQNWRKSAQEPLPDERPPHY